MVDFTSLPASGPRMRPGEDLQSILADTRRSVNVGLTLVHRRRRRANVKPTLTQRHVSAGMLFHKELGSRSETATTLPKLLDWSLARNISDSGSWIRIITEIL